MKRIVSIVIIMTLFFTAAVSAEPANESGEVLKLDLNESIQIALENNLDLQSVLQEIDARKLQKKISNFYKNELEDADDSLDNAEDQLTEVNEGIEFYESHGMEVPQYLLDAKDTLQSGLSSGEATFDSALDEVAESQEETLGLTTSRDLGLRSTTDLNKKMANVALEVTQIGYEMGKQQIALLVEKNYYDVIKYQNIVNSKKKALERAEGQYEIVKAAFEAGVKAKDDLLLTQSQFELMSADYEKAKSELENVKIEFKKTLNIPFETEIILEDIDDKEISDFDLEEGIAKGLKNRLEIQQAIGQLEVDRLNFELTARRYTSNTFMYQEAKLNTEKSQLEYQIALQQVESDIRQAYNTLQATIRMREHIKNSLENAQENLEIARFRYNTGFGVESVNLKTIEAEDMTGTIMEVLAAQENLAEIEEKIVEVEAGYNLALANYLTAIGENQVILQNVSEE